MLLAGTDKRFKKRVSCEGLRWDKTLKSQFNICKKIKFTHKNSNTREAAKHGVGVVSSVKHLQRVPVLLCDKADHLDLERGKNRSNRVGFREQSSECWVIGASREDY